MQYSCRLDPWNPIYPYYTFMICQTYFSMLIHADGIQILPLAPDMHNLTSLIKSDSNNVL